MANKDLSIESNETLDGIKVVSEEYADPDTGLTEHVVPVRDKILRDLLGEVSATPTANTLLERINSLQEKVDQLLLSQDEDDNLNVSQNGSKATDAVAVTPDDANDLATVPTEGLYIGVTGDVKVDMIDGSTVTFTALKGGIVYPYSVSRVYDTDTTATDIVALY